MGSVKGSHWSRGRNTGFSLVGPGNQAGGGNRGKESMCSEVVTVVKVSISCGSTF